MTNILRSSPSGQEFAIESGLRLTRREIWYSNGTKDTIEGGTVVNSPSTSFSLQADGFMYDVWLGPGGTGGNRSPRTSSSAAAGSSGPGGGAVARHTFFRPGLEAYIAILGTPIPILVGAGGAGAPQGGAGTSNANSAQGTLGGVSAFGDLLTAYPGGRGETPSLNGSQVNGGAGGGWLSAGTDGLSNNFGGAPVGSQFANAGPRMDGDYGGARGAIPSDVPSGTIVAGSALHGGGGGGGNRTPTVNVNPFAGGPSLFGVPGAGAGGSHDTNTARNGGDAGRRLSRSIAGQEPANNTGGGPLGGTGQSTGTSAGNGADGAPGILGLYPGESGAGGGALIATGGTGLTGRGGDGGFPSGCGGSSGAAYTGLGQACAVARGGNGADGVVVVDTYDA